MDYVKLEVHSWTEPWNDENSLDASRDLRSYDCLETFHASTVVF